MSHGQSFNLPGDGNWYLVATMGGRHAEIEYTYNQTTSHNPSISSGKIQFINSSNSLTQYHWTKGYASWNQPQFALINKGSLSEIWVKATVGVNTGGFNITGSQYANLVLGATSDSNLSDNGGVLKIFDKLPDNAHTYTGNINLAEGKLGIGTTTFGSHKLAVEGSIGAREIKVEASGWSDFVFAKDYEIPTLEELEAYILQNQHLPDIPNETEIIENGVNLGEMNAKLLQKIEELTLYLIEQNKQNKAQQKKIEQLEQKVAALVHKSKG
ncbi:hypothetical protein [Flagellimonas hadalis]|uniref:Uncharacterized protein n=1 Tax=Flagellimonas hadalis TaxID=2597517 RepID=A0A5N5IZW1_9FLAO|nr:hypothetical protein [Allomuricauda hadalis]KAB5483643.1 hypothetical protein FOT42_017575 [Allomuricauda hadalis]